MDLAFHKFTKRLIIITLITAILIFGLTFIVPEYLISISWPFILGFFFAVTLLAHKFLLKKSDGNHGKFINAFMLITTIKLMLFFTIIIVYVLINRHDALGFILTFFTNYLIFTIFEILSILKFLQKS